MGVQSQPESVRGLRLIYLQFMAVPIGAVILFGLGYMILGLWNECGAAWKVVSDRDEELTDAKQRICDLLKDNELANKECEQNRIVIEAAKEERLKMLTERSELRKARMDAAEALADQSKQAKEQWEKMQASLNAHADKIWTLAKDIDERSEVIRKLSTLAESYRQQIAELKAARPARGGNGRFARRQVAG